MKMASYRARFLFSKGGDHTFYSLTYTQPTLWVYRVGRGIKMAGFEKLHKEEALVGLLRQQQIDSLSNHKGGSAEQGGLYS
jgi:hypothetical protein